MENAAKYASPTGIVIEGSVLADGAGVAVTVTDRGEGIPPEDLPRVFERFFRREEGRPTGTGLGLWITRGLVEAHGGTVEATSTVGQGSTFRVTLPLHPRPPSPTPCRGTRSRHSSVVNACQFARGSGRRLVTGGGPGAAERTCRGWGGGGRVSRPWAPRSPTTSPASAPRPWSACAPPPTSTP